MNCDRRGHRQRSERGSIIVMTALLMALLFVMVGLCIDVSRIYMVRAELQNAADSAALSAARELNSGTSGINDAVLRANEIVNTYGFGKTSVGIASVQFAANLNDDPYMSAGAATANPAIPPTIRFVKVTTQSTSTSIIFAIGALTDPSCSPAPCRSQTRTAVAGMSVGINTICDFFPVVVALSNPNPAPNTTMTLNFVQGDPGPNTFADKDYIVVDVPEISGNGLKESVLLAAGVSNICQTLNVTIPFHITPSANKNNGPKAMAWGANSRFDDPGKNYVDAATYPPDTNIREGITFDQYKNRTSVTPPQQSPPGKDQRRILIVPIVAPGTYNASPGPPTIRFGAFFLKNKILESSGDLEVEWIDEKLVIGRGGFDPNGGSSSLTLPVLYK